MNFFNKSFDGFLQNANENSFFLKPNTSEEIINLISSYESTLVGPNSLGYTQTQKQEWQLQRLLCYTETQ